MSTQVILLERVESLGGMGDVVTVKPGYARNFLLPKAKALRATKENIAYYEAQKANLQKLNAEKVSDAQKVAKKVEGTKVVIIRQAAEGGQLFGSVTARDIAEEITNGSSVNVTRGQVLLNQNFKSIGIFSVEVALHAEVKVTVKVNIARTAAEADVQEKTGKAVIAADTRGGREKAPQDLDAAKESMLEDGALAAEKAEAEEEAKLSAADAEKAAQKAAKKAAKAPAAAAEDAAE